MIQAIIFDLYGVLALNGWQAFKVRHFTKQPSKWNELFELGRQVDAGKASYYDLVRFTAIASGESEAAVRHELEHTVANTKLLDYIQAALQPKYKLGILSNAPGNAALDIFIRQQRELFHAVVLSGFEGHTKPDKQMYTAVAAKLNVDLRECLFVDDQIRHCDGARAAGMEAVLFTDVPQLKVELDCLLPKTPPTEPFTRGMASDESK